MADEEDNAPPVEPEMTTNDADDDPVPLFSPGAREEAETELLEAWTASSEEEQITQIARRPAWPSRLMISAAALVATAIVVLALVNLTGQNTRTDPTLSPEARQRATANAKVVERRRARRQAALRERAKARHRKWQIAKQKARQRARLAEQAAPAEPAVEVPVQTQQSSPPAPEPPPSPPSPVSPSTPPPDPAPSSPEPATPGQAIEAFGPGP